MDTLARTLARYALQARDDDFPAEARTRALDAITDCIACMIAGAKEPLASMVRNVVSGAPRETGRALLVGTNDYSTPADAALYNGAIAHALDYDDTNHPGYAHPSAAILPAMMAVADMAGATGRDIVTAYIIGLEVIGKLGRTMHPQHMKQGWHGTITFGTLAAAVCAGRVMKLTEDQMVMAIGISGSAASGFRANFGTMVKPLHAGYAARNGVLAAQLAREGFEASEQSLEHKYGYANVLNDGRGVDFSQLKCWGEPLEIMTDYGLALKPYPSCGATHTGIEAALHLRKEIGNGEIRSIRAGVSELAFEPLITGTPKSPLEGKFSLPYCISAALTKGAVNLDTFSNETFADAKIQALLQKVTMEADDRVRHDPEFASVVSIEMADGSRHEKLVPLAIGKPERWFSTGQMFDKFLDCGRLVYQRPKIEEVFGVLRSYDSTGPANRLSAALMT